MVCTAGFVVHRGRIIPTLASMQEPLPAARSKQAKERTSTDSKAEERGKCLLALCIFIFDLLVKLCMKI